MSLLYNQERKPHYPHGKYRTYGTGELVNVKWRPVQYRTHSTNIRTYNIYISIIYE